MNAEQVSVDAELDDLDAEYARLHTAKEDAYWTAKMGLAEDAGAAQAALDAHDIALARFLGAAAHPPRMRELLAQTPPPSAEQQLRLTGWLRTFSAHVLESPEAQAVSEALTSQNGAMARVRANMPLGYGAPGGDFVAASSNELARVMLVDPAEPQRLAAWQGLRSIETYLLERGFLDVIKQRNRLGRLQGAEDFYDWKARQNEGMSKHELFALLDDLEERTREAGLCAIDGARIRHPRKLVKPWNIPFLTHGDLALEKDPYFPFDQAISRWGRSFTALGIDFAGAELVLDLLDRPGKFENGFMHGPVVAFRRNGRRVPARVHFTANALPGKPGAGPRALATLFHEGGHAAHFANIDMPSPCFGQEFAPTSAAFAETQSMFCDSLLDDSAWLTRYAQNDKGEAMPLELIERGIDAVQPFAAWYQRVSLAVCYGERALYEIRDSELSVSRVLEALRDVEQRFLGLDDGSFRPILSVPHVLSGDFCAYYHSYVLAQMAVYQVRAHFLERDGHLVDNPRIGPDLTRVFWQPGNSVGFAELVQRLTSQPLSAEHLAAHLNATPEEAKQRARDGILALRRTTAPTSHVALNAKLRIVHGSQTVAELDDPQGDFSAFSEKFAEFIRARAAKAQKCAPAVDGV